MVPANLFSRGLIMIKNAQNAQPKRNQITEENITSILASVPLTLTGRMSSMTKKKYMKTAPIGFQQQIKKIISKNQMNQKFYRLKYKDNSLIIADKGQRAKIRISDHKKLLYIICTCYTRNSSTIMVLFKFRDICVISFRNS